jgi:hypothetical protein
LAWFPKKDLRLALHLWTLRVRGERTPETEFDLISRYGTAEQRLVAELYQATLAADDELQWGAHVSRYLAQFKLSPVRIRPGTGSRFARLAAEPGTTVCDGPKVSVIVAAFNAADTIGWSLGSVLGQTWRNLDVIVVDDASRDGTWDRLKEIASRDARVRILRNSVNVGPFVSRNRALPLACGTYLTGHDADDWAHPQRIERQFQRLQENPGSIAIANQMLRLSEELRFRHFSVEGHGLLEDPTRLHPVSSLFLMQPFREQLGHWDTVRFSGDGELLKRAQVVFGSKILTTRLVTNLSLDVATSIMNDPVYGRSNRQKRALSPTRVAYRSSYAKWHKTMQPGSSRIEFPQAERCFAAPDVMIVDPALIEQLLASDGPAS